MSFEWKNNRLEFNNHKLLPTSNRMLIVGQSNSGKTHLLFKLITEGYLDYNRLYIFSKSLYQDEYQLLIEGLKHKLHPVHILHIFNNSKDIPCKEPKEAVEYYVECLSKEVPDNSWKGNIEVYPYSDANAIPRPEEVDKQYKNLIIFDDCMNERNQDPAKEYYTRGRHSNVQCIYISQNYHKLDRHSIRSNANVLILFKLSKLDIQNLHRDIVAMDIPEYKEFEIFANKVWDKKYSFMVIDKNNDDVNWRYRKGFEIPYNQVL